MNELKTLLLAEDLIAIADYLEVALQVAWRVKQNEVKEVKENRALIGVGVTVQTGKKPTKSDTIKKNRKSGRMRV